LGQKHTVKRAETIVQIAQQYGFRAWEPIWDHPENADLRALRPSAHVLAQGDELHIPDKELAEFSCETNQAHVFRVRSMKQWIDQVVLDENDEPLAGRPFELKAAGTTITGETDNSGSIREEIPLSAKTAELKVWIEPGNDDSRLTWKLQLGDLDPVETPYGLKGHLTNLGYDCGNVDDQLDEKTREAVREFQRDHALAVTGEGDPPTLEKLKSLFTYSENGA
jgi:hypothetical protein